MAKGVRGGPSHSIKIRHGGSEGVRAIRSRSDEGNQTRKDKRLRVMLTGGVRVSRARARSSTRGPSRSIKIGWGGQTGETDGCGRRRSSLRR
jgi:hypothetical protein